jgi:hypothetical protein
VSTEKRRRIGRCCVTRPSFLKHAIIYERNFPEETLLDSVFLRARRFAHLGHGVLQNLSGFGKLW